MTDEQQDAIRQAFNEWVDQVGLDPIRYTLEIGKLESIFTGGFGYPVTVSFGEQHGRVMLDPGILASRELNEVATQLVHALMSNLLRAVVTLE